MRNKKNRNKKEEGEEKELRDTVHGVDSKWGWFVVFNSFICNMIVDGIQYTFANFLEPILENLAITYSRTALIGSLLSGFYNFSGPIAGAVGNKFGFRMVAITGSLISGGGLMLSYFAPSVEYLYFFYGILGGLGFGMIYMASVIITSLYFEKYRALAASLSVCGTGVGTFVFSPLGSALVHTWGWRYALVIEGGIALICILCGLSFKPLEFVSVVPLSKEPSEVNSFDSASIYRHGSVYYQSDTQRKTLPNEAYPTFKEVLQDAATDDRRPTVSSVIAKTPQASAYDSGTNIRRAPIYSIVGTMSRVPENPRSCKQCFRVCCFKFWHCNYKHRDLNLGDRPLYRDDIFYGGSLTSLREYSALEPANYHLSVSRIPDAQELEQHVTQKCCVCHAAFLRTCITMTGLNLLKSRVFLFLCISSFLYTMSVYIPYVFVKKLAAQYYVPDSHAVWLLSAIGVANTVGRLVSGIIKSFVKVNAAVLVLSCLIVSGTVSFIFIIEVNLFTLIIFSCVFGGFTAPFISLRPVIIVDFLGLEKLTNAFGLVLLGQGIASIIGPPIAGLLEEGTGKCEYAMYLTGSLLLLSAMSLLVSVIFHCSAKKVSKSNM